MNAFLDNLCPIGDVLLLGSEQHSVDLILALKAKSFKGTIHVLSRSGCFPHARRPSRSDQKWPLFWNYRSPRTVRSLLKLVRAEVESAYSRGVDWRQVIDALAPVTPRIWQSLPLQEKKRFVRHVRVFWDAHYHCIAPEIWDLLQDMREEGQVVVHRGALCEYRDTSDGAEVQYRDALSENETMLRVSRVVNCESPDTKPISFRHPVLNSLLVRGLAQPHALQLGLDVDEHGRLISRDGIASRCLYAIGPVRKGALWETTTVRDIRRQAIEMAGHLIEFLEAQPSIFRRALVKSLLSSRNQGCCKTTDTFSD